MQCRYNVDSCTVSFGDSKRLYIQFRCNFLVLFSRRQRSKPVFKYTNPRNSFFPKVFNIF